MATFKVIFSAVLVLFFSMIIYSIITPEINKINTEVAKVDSTGVTTNTLETVNSIPDPKGSIKQGAGNFLLRLLENHPFLFILLAVIVTVVCLYFGVTVTQIKNF
ncbi:hypothetical protein JXM83_00395 [Candidatus Woesearchaeota archaeon]|nr:hypothetical protein [Candidatus Woesearchaeota archaeon]